ncbi:helix-turn-helix domain-containing protein [Enterococcus sp. DIV0660C]|uniref:Rgg family transcriptional regulator n=1 Tax=Enterococcus sp. DIV0660C TaxID=2230880 RepID=UPI001A8DC0AC|nr:helix-turn-helix domain-containing protein [Enterococcus sp. DIV0660C]MBO0431823.1 helix-turn-helix domain-containing protein [Enterococcus sp. DIV0660C]
MPKHAFLIRKLRKERGFTQEQLTMGISQRGTLAAFESRGTKISFELLISYLEKMNVTLEEYEFLLNDGSLSPKQKLTNYFLTTPALTSAQEDELLKEYEKTGNIFYRLLYAQRKIILNHLDNEAITPEVKKEAQLIMNYLEHIDTWGHFELSVFSRCLFVFKTDYIVRSFYHSVTKMGIYQDTAVQQNLLANFILNGVRLSFTRSSNTLRTLFLAELKKLAELHTNSLNMAYYKIFSALDRLSQGDQSVIPEIDQGIHFFNWLGLTTMTDFILRLKSTYS